MSHQMTPQRTLRQARFDEIKTALSPQGVRLIVGEAFPGEGRCLRLGYLKDDRGNPVGYRVSVDDIRREPGKVFVRRGVDKIEVRPKTMFIADEVNVIGRKGAVCPLPDVENILSAAAHLLARPQFEQEVQL